MSNYYIIGSKYGDRENGYRDIFPVLLARSVIAVGFSSANNLSGYLGKDKAVITSYLHSVGESSDSQSALRLFLNIKPGDVIAVKRHSSPNGTQAQLVIGGYAIVNGQTIPKYSHDKDLGHTISVNFIETNEIIFPYGYGKTVHKITDKKRIQAIFGNYGKIIPVSNQTNNNLVSGVINKTNIYPSLVGTKAGYIMNKTHNIMQNEIYNDLVSQYGKDQVTMEQNYVDIMIETNNSLFLYEIKTYMSVKYCIREAIGQLLHYDWKISSKKQVEYIIVGPNKPSIDDIALINYIQLRMKVKIQYQQKII